MNMRLRPKLGVVAIGAAALVAGALLPGAASARPHHIGFSGKTMHRAQSLGRSRHTTSFQGSCSVQGTVAFTPPVSNTNARLRYHYTATGTCSGQIDGRDRTTVPVTLHHEGVSYGSCLQAHTTAPGHGVLSFGHGTDIRYTLDFRTVGTEVDFNFYGRRSGMATGRGTFITQRSSPQIVTECAGPGLHKAPMDLTLSTQTSLSDARPNRTHVRDW